MFGSDDINHSNFVNATKCLNKSWWYLLKHVCFILKLKDFCNTCVHFQWKKTNASRHDRDTVSAAHAWFAWQAKLRICGSENCRVLFYWFLLCLYAFFFIVFPIFWNFWHKKKKSCFWVKFCVFPFSSKILWLFFNFQYPENWELYPKYMWTELDAIIQQQISFCFLIGISENDSPLENNYSRLKH